MLHGLRPVIAILLCFCALLPGSLPLPLVAEEGAPGLTGHEGRRFAGSGPAAHEEASQFCSPSLSLSRLTELKAAAEGGILPAQWQLAMMYCQGKVVPQNYVEARKWFQKAADQGDPWARLILAQLYYKGHGVQKDDAAAMKWWEKTAEQGLVPGAVAQYKIGNMYYFGEGVLQDYALAAKWFKRAAEQGNPQAQFSLGFVYDEGLGVPRSVPEALKWYRAAAEQGDLDAQSGLAAKHYSGEGVQKNYLEAAKWYRKAAEQGDGWAQRNLATIYRQGQGVSKNYVTAYYWANQAASQGNEEAAALLGELSRLMTPDQLAQARKLPSLWKHAPSDLAVESQGGGESAPTHQPSSAPETPLIAGTGLVVSREGHILTSCRALRGCRGVACDLAGKLVPVSVVRTDGTNDLALLKLGVPGPRPFKFREGKPIHAGDGALVVDYPLQETPAPKPRLEKATVTALAGPGNDPDILQIKVLLNPKNHGGPLLDAAGNVIGMMTAKYESIRATELGGDLPRNLNFALNAAIMRAFLEVGGVTCESAQSNLKLDASALGDLAKGATVLIVCPSDGKAP